MLSSALFWGCRHRPQPEEAEPEVAEEAGKSSLPSPGAVPGFQPPADTPAEESLVVITVDDQEEITWGELRDVGRVMAATALQAQDDFDLKRTSFRSSVIQHAIDAVLILGELEERGIQPDADNLKRVEEQTAQAAQRVEAIGLGDLDSAELERFIKGQAGRSTLRSALVPPVDRDALWGWYEHRASRVALLLMSVANFPSSREVDLFTEHHTDEIREHYHAHPDQFYLPPMRRITRLYLDGRNPQDLPEQKDEYEQELRTEQQLVTPNRAPEAWRVEVGELSAVMGEGEDRHLFRVDEHLPPKRRDLDEALQREIAASLVVERELNRAAWDKARELADLLRKTPDVDAAAVATERRIRTRRTPLFHRGDSVPGIGLVPLEVTAEIFADLSEDKVGAILGPYRVRQELVTFQVVQVTLPDKERLERYRERYTELLIREKGEGLLSALLHRRYQEADFQYDWDHILPLWERTFSPDAPGPGEPTGEPTGESD